jgi:hypothetical protein
MDATSNDSSNGQPDAQESETSTPDGGDGGDGGGGEDASDASCPGSWLVVPAFDPKLDVPLDGGGVVLLHAAGVGTQNYTCTATADAGSMWVLTGPTADLNDCRGTLIGHHFASVGGAGYPEWQTLDGTYVVGHKQQAVTPDGGAGSVAWLLLQAVDAGGGTGTLSQVAYIQRLDTDGGLAAGACGDAGDMIQLPYSADYYFYGP